MAGKNIVVPELAHSFNVYSDDAKRLIGISGEIDLGELKTMSETVNLAGMLGEYDAPAAGHTSSIKLKIPFTILYEDLFGLLDPSGAVQLTLRGALQHISPETFKIDEYGVKIVVKGRMTNTALGKLAKAKKGDPEVELEVLYIKIMIDGKETLEIDKLNFKFMVNGKDHLAKIRSLI